MAAVRGGAERVPACATLRAAYCAMMFPPAYASLALLLPESTFALSPGYRLMGALMTEGQWASTGAAVWLLGAAAWWRGTVGAVQAALCLAGCWHFAVALLFLLSTPASIVPGSLLSMAVLICLLALRI